MMHVSIRRAIGEDAEEIAALYVRTSRATEREFVPDDVLDAMQPGDYFERWRRTLAAPAPHATWVAEHDGMLVGFCSVEPDPDAESAPTSGHLDMLFVDPDCAGHGIGARLLAEAVAYMATVGFTEATLWVLRANERVQRFYRREGWLPTNVTIRAGEGMYAVTLLRMRRTLAETEDGPRA